MVLTDNDKKQKNASVISCNGAPIYRRSHPLILTAEMYILEKRSCFSYSDYQFGFVHDRGTNTEYMHFAIIIKSCPVFVCSLDAEGAFDGIPHPIIFMKMIGVMPEVCWESMKYWYSKIHVKIKWNIVGKHIQICKGTLQGGLTSSFIFNVFYKQLINRMINLIQ